MAEKDFLWIGGWVYISPNSKMGHFVMYGGTYFSLCGEYVSEHEPEVLTIPVSPRKRCKFCWRKLYDIKNENEKNLEGI
jgi:hypothetical protein